VSRIYKGHRGISGFTEGLNSTFTLLKNRRFHPFLRSRINSAAIVKP
jgi:hypothetical protein